MESNINIEKKIQICKELCREETPVEGDEIQDVVGRFPIENPVEQLYNNPNSDMNHGLRLATLNKLGAIVKKKKILCQIQTFVKQCEYQMQNNKISCCILFINYCLIISLHYKYSSLDLPDAEKRSPSNS